MSAFDRLRWLAETGSLSNNLSVRTIAPGDTLTVDTPTTVVVMPKGLEATKLIGFGWLATGYSLLVGSQVVLLVSAINNGPLALAALHGAAAVGIAGLGCWSYRQVRAQRVREVTQMLLDATRGS